MLMDGNLLIIKRPNAITGERAYYEQFSAVEELDCFYCGGYGSNFASYGRPWFVVKCEACGGTGHERDQTHCKVCGESIDIESGECGACRYARRDGGDEAQQALDAWTAAYGQRSA